MRDIDNFEGRRLWVQAATAVATQYATTSFSKLYTSDPAVRSSCWPMA